MRFIGYAASIIICVLLLAGSYAHKIEVEPDEAWGFITGAACVWLTVKENIWNWPIGNASSAFYAYTFWHTRLFGDMWLQVVYVILGFLGWYWWLRGGEKHTTLTVHRINAPMTAILVVIVITSTAWMDVRLAHAHDVAPFLDALTTTLSLAAQFLLTKKILENWYVWITADVIYIGLYLYKHLYLTSLLYAIFIVMCVAGIRAWRRSHAAKAGETATPAGSYA